MNSAIVGACADRASTGVARDSGARPAVATTTTARTRPSVTTTAAVRLLELKLNLRSPTLVEAISGGGRGMSEPHRSERQYPTLQICSVASV